MNGFLKTVCWVQKCAPGGAKGRAAQPAEKEASADAESGEEEESGEEAQSGWTAEQVGLNYHLNALLAGSECSSSKTDGYASPLVALNVNG